MNELQERLRRFADEGARHARPPGVEAALRRGRRRRRRQAGAAGLALLALLAGGLGIRGLLEPSPVHPVAPGPTVTRVTRGPATLPREFEPIPGRVIAHGDRTGYRWRLVAHRKRLPQGQRQVALIFQRDDYGPGADLVTLEPVTLSLLFPSTREQDPVVAGIVAQRAARVRLWLERGGAQLPPVDVPLFDGGRDFSQDFFVAFVRKGSLLRDVLLLDRQGRPICRQRFAKRSGEDHYPIPNAGSCF